MAGKRFDENEAHGGHVFVEASHRYLVEQLISSLVAALAMLPHDLARGESWEEAVRRSLMDLLPGRYRAFQGQVIDEAGTMTNQQDMVIVDAGVGTPLWRMGEIGIVPIEIVAGAVEVKSSLSTSDVWGAVDNIGSVKRKALKRRSGEDPPRSPFGAIVGRSGGTSFDTLVDHYRAACAEVGREERPDALWIVDQGLAAPGHDGTSWDQTPSVQPLIARPEGTWLASWHELDEDDLSLVRCQDSALAAMLFVDRMSRHLRAYPTEPPDLLEYQQGAADGRDHLCMTVHVAGQAKRPPDKKRGRS